LRLSLGHIRQKKAEFAMIMMTAGQELGFSFHVTPDDDLAKVKACSITFT
jgi:hypothetical protein